MKSTNYLRFEKVHVAGNNSTNDNITKTSKSTIAGEGSDEGNLNKVNNYKSAYNGVQTFDRAPHQNSIELQTRNSGASASSSEITKLEDDQKTRHVQLALFDRQRLFQEQSAYFNEK